MKNIEQTLTSIEAAEMVEKQHKDLMRDIKRYIKQMYKANEEYGAERKVAPGDFFKESIYKDANNQERPCYRITKKGCEFIAHKLTGVKGTIFTARYINRFHEMEDILKRQQEPEYPWFIRDFKKQGKIMLFRDFKAITGIELCGNYTAWERPDRLVGGVDYNGWAWHTTVNKEEFKKEYGFDYGDDNCMMYLYLRGIKKAVRAIENDLKDRRKLTVESKRLILDGVRCAEKKKDSIIVTNKAKELEEAVPLQISIIVNGNKICM